MGKAISVKPLATYGLSTVIIYAAASAAAGYVVKIILDAASKKINQFFKENSTHENE